MLSLCLHNNDVIIKLTQLSYSYAMTSRMINQRERVHNKQLLYSTGIAVMIIIMYIEGHTIWVMIQYKEECIINDIVNSKQL